jgi:hypothetical protein
MNCHYGDWVYKKYKMEDPLADQCFTRASQELSSVFERQGVDCQIVAASA